MSRRLTSVAIAHREIVDFAKKKKKKKRVSFIRKTFYRIPLRSYPILTRRVERVLQFFFSLFFFLHRRCKIKSIDKHIKYVTDNNIITCVFYY